MLDSHAHVVSDDLTRYPAAPAGETLKPGDLDDPMTIERLVGDMDASGVERAILVQRGSIYGFDNRYVCDSAKRFPDRLAAVCSIDATAEDGAASVRRWVGDHGAAGVRLMQLVREQDISWLYAPLAMQVWRTAHDLHVPVCVHFFPWNRVEGLTCLAQILQELPDLQVVIDHFSNMDVRQPGPDYGVDDLLAGVAAFAGVRTKFTTVPLGRLEEAGVDARPIVKRVVDLFGAERVMWGSDITQSKGTYGSMVELGQRAIEALSSSEQDQVLQGAATAVYGGAWR